MAKVLVTLDDKLLARIDREAERKGMTRSAYLSYVAAREVGAKQGPGRRARVGHALSRLDTLFAASGRREDATKAIRRDRDSR